jgi:hypothetical protein
MMNINTLTEDNTDIKQHMCQIIKDLTKAYCNENDITEIQQKQMAFRINAIVQSTALLTDNTLPSEDIVEMLRDCVEYELK